MIWYVYIVQCRDTTLYTGVTNDLEKRIQVHNNKKGAKYTAVRTPVTLVWNAVCASHSEALRQERQIKQLDRRKKLSLISGV